MKNVIAIILVFFGWPVVAPVMAQLNESVAELDGVGVEEKLGDKVPLDLKFQDSDGKEISLGSIFKGERPIILSLNYAECPLLCQLQLTGLVNGMRDLKLTTGKDFDVVSVSVDPLETVQQARQIKTRYVRQYGRPGSAGGWKFLTGSEASIKALAESVGFQYRYVPERKEYAHAAVVMVCTPSGTISRYLYGVNYPPQTLRLSLVEASEGKVGTTLDRVLLFCFHYDSATGRYTLVARRLLKIAAAITLFAISVGVIPAWWRRRPVQSRQSSERVRIS
ncbi:MAG: SCO family protein [Planctomycetaceae bacterium]|nr:SCO family protein [Planctomycetaceae bacterium]